MHICTAVCNTFCCSDIHDDLARGQPNEIGKSPSFGLFSVGWAAASFKFQPKLSVGFGTDRNWAFAACVPRHCILLPLWWTGPGHRPFTVHSY